MAVQNSASASTGTNPMAAIGRPKPARWSYRGCRSPMFEFTMRNLGSQLTPKASTRSEATTSSELLRFPEVGAQDRRDPCARLNPLKIRRSCHVRIAMIVQLSL